MSRPYVSTTRPLDRRPSSSPVGPVPRSCRPWRRRFVYAPAEAESRRQTRAWRTLQAGDGAWGFEKSEKSTSCASRGAWATAQQTQAQPPPAARPTALLLSCDRRLGVGGHEPYPRSSTLRPDRTGGDPMAIIGRTIGWKSGRRVRRGQGPGREGACRSLWEAGGRLADHRPLGRRPGRCPNGPETAPSDAM